MNTSPGATRITRPIRVIVTRPTNQAQQWLAIFQARGIDVFHLPLIDIFPVQDAKVLKHNEAVFSNLAEFKAVMWVSANAVNHSPLLGGVVSDSKGLLTSSVRHWVTGPGTARALVQLGVSPDQIDQAPEHAQQWDSESLWLRVASQVSSGDRILVVRGCDSSGVIQGRDWLTKQLESLGTEVQAVATYTRQLPQWTHEQYGLATDALAKGACWLFSSREAVSNLMQLMPHSSWSRGLAVATHPRIAERLRQSGWPVVYETLPNQAAVIASIESLI